MKKGLIIILAVAIIGGLGVYTKSHNSSASAGTPSQTSNVTDTSSGGSTGTSSNSGSSSSATYKDGTYNGDTISTAYGDVQVAVVVSGGKISDVKFLQMPSDRGHSQEVTYVASPLLRKSTLSNQNGQVDFVSGATSTSEAYQQSIQAALNKAS